MAAAVDGIDTVFHTAAIIDLMGGPSVTEEYRQRSFAVNVTGTQNLVHAAQAAGVQRFVYTASNSVVMGGQTHFRRRRNPALHRTIQRPVHRDQSGRREVCAVAKRLAEWRGRMLTCSIRPSGIWGRGDQTMFRKVFENVLAGHVKVLVGSKKSSSITPTCTT